MWFGMRGGKYFQLLRKIKRFFQVMHEIAIYNVFVIRMLQIFLE